MAKKQYLLVNIEEDLSKLNGTVYWRLTFLDVTHHPEVTQWEMIVDPAYRNFARSGWDQVIRDPEPFGLYENLRATQRRTQSGTGVLTADSHPEKIAWVATHEEIFTVLEGLQADQADEYRGQFARLFA